MLSGFIQYCSSFLMWLVSFHTAFCRLISKRTLLCLLLNWFEVWISFTRFAGWTPCQVNDVGFKVSIEVAVTSFILVICFVHQVHDVQCVLREHICRLCFPLLHVYLFVSSVMRSRPPRRSLHFFLIWRADLLWGSLLFVGRLVLTPQRQACY